MGDNNIKNQIFMEAKSLGANIVRSCSVSKWEEEPIQAPEYWPQNSWPWVKNVIVLGIPLFPAMTNTTPSMIYQELYDTSNRVLDEMAYKLTNFIVTELHYKALFFPRDCYYSIETLLKKPCASFSHVVAAYYAGVGTFGDSHNLITKEFGPRLRIVSILTDAPIEPDEQLKENLCIHCKRCLKVCPIQCLKENGKDLYAYDKVACTQHHVDIKNENHWPCGMCINACPVGEDMKAFRGTEVITKQGIKHAQVHGS